MQACRIAGCPGHYEEQRKVYAAQFKDHLFVIDHVPMRICDFCGDTLLTLETVRRLEQIRDDPPHTEATIPLYDFAGIEESAPSSTPQASAVAD